MTVLSLVSLSTVNCQLSTNMWYIIIGVIVLGVIAAIAGYFRNKKLQQMLERGEISEIPEAREIPEECCGQHETCERDSLLAAVSKKIEYYDDE